MKFNSFMGLVITILISSLMTWTVILRDEINGALELFIEGFVIFNILFAIYLGHQGAEKEKKK